MFNLRLRDYQESGVSGIRATFAAAIKSVLFVLPTGGGKTVIFTYITSHAEKKGNRVYILVHRQELLTQTSNSLDALGVEHGLIAPGFPRTGDRIQIASVQTLIRRIGRVPRPDLLIIDEAHHANAASWAKIIDHFDGVPLIGVTATPCRLDGKGLGVESGGYFEKMVTGPNIKQLIEDGYLARPIVYAPPTGLDLSGVKSRFGDYKQKDLAAAMDKPTITGSAVEHYSKICPGAPAIAFCVSVAHAEHVAAEFRAAGYRAASVDGSMGDGQRKGLITALGRGNLDVLASCDIISEGTDIPVVTAAILLRPTQSLSLYIQQGGRALRPVYAPGHDLRTKGGRLCAIAASSKKFAIILDHVGNCLRHGLLDEDREWTLDGKPPARSGTKEFEAVVNVKQCPKCFAVHDKQPSCPLCGFVYEVADAVPEQVEGELQEVTPEEIAAIKEDRRRRQGAAKTLEELKAFGKEMGYKPGWAPKVWASRQGKSSAYGRG
jgi:superfamily II DNA or RNA helicase